MPQIPNDHAAAVLLLTAFALVLFTRPRILIESTSLAILALLLVGFELFPFNVNGAAIESHIFYSGFGHEALIAVCALMIMGQGLASTGALVPVGRGLARLWKLSPLISLLAILIAGAVGSAFINNTPIVVVLIPILVNVAQRNNMSTAPWLLPMNFSTLLGGTSTTIGTSTNLLVVGVAADLGLRKFGMFDFAVPAMIAGSIGIIYLWLIAPLLLRNRAAKPGEPIGLKFTFQMQFAEDSDLIGATVSDLQAKTDNKLQILKIRKAADEFSDAGTAPLPDVTIAPNDRITVIGTADQLKEFEDVLDASVNGIKITEDADDGHQLAQIVVLESSHYVGRTLAATRFSDAYGIEVLAVHRSTEPVDAMPEGIAEICLKAGDVLLAQGPRDRIDKLSSIQSLLVLDGRIDLPASSRWPVAIATLIAVVALSALGILPIAASSVCGVLVMLATGCIDWRQVQKSLSVSVIMIVVVSLALGSALTVTGASDYIAELFIYLLAGSPTAIVLGGLILLMATLTNIVSNNAAAVIGTPIAISMATQLGAPPEAFVLAVLFGANLSFATPIAYKTNVLVMNAGNYKFSDFLLVGLPLVVILWIAYSLILTRIYAL